MFYLIINFKLDKTDDRIKAKRILLNIEKMEGYNCDTTCKNNYIEIKYRKDKSATGWILCFKIFLKISLGARICCIDYARILTISSEEDTEVLIMKKGNIGEYDISYQKGGLFNWNSKIIQINFILKMVLQKFCYFKEV